MFCLGGLLWAFLPAGGQVLLLWGGGVVRRTERFGGWNQGQAGESQKGCWGTSDVSQHFSAMDSSEGL